MLTTLVLTRSYSGNLMSLLAVRYIPMPVQSLQDIIDQKVTLLLMRGSAQTQTILVRFFSLQSPGHKIILFVQHYLGISFECSVCVCEFKYNEICYSYRQVSHMLV